MIIIRVKGGLGNQLFQYAAGCSLAERLNQKVLIDTSFFAGQSLRGYRLSSLNIENNELYGNEKIRYEILKNRYINKALRMGKIGKVAIYKNSCYLLETRPDIMEDFFTLEEDNIFLDGYFQSEEYFKNSRIQLVKQFTPRYSPQGREAEIGSQIESVNSVALHVRRGDFTNEKSKFHYLLSKEYYDDAINYMASHVESPVYYWFSDDIDWVKSCFGEQYNFKYISLQTQNADIDELMLMKRCKHIVTANSTFSWWGAWLNINPLGIKIAPKKRFGNKKMIPEEWIKL